MSLYREDDRFLDLLGLAIKHEGTLAERVKALLEYVRVHVLDDCEAVLLSQDQFDFEAQRLRLGQPEGAVRNDVNASIYKVLRHPHFLEKVDQAFPAWEAQIVRDNERSPLYWISETAAAAGIDVQRWRTEHLQPAGLEDVWGATTYVDNGSFLTVIIPLHCGGQRPTTEQIEFIQTLPPVLAPILMSSKPTARAWGLEESHADGLSEAQSRVLTLALSGLTEKEIAHRIHRSPHTVNSHLRAIYRHYRVSSRGELLALAIDRERKTR